MHKLRNWFSSLVILILVFGVFANPRPVAASETVEELIPNPAAEAYMLETLATSNTVLLSNAFADPRERVISGAFLLALLNDETYHSRPWLTFKDMTVVGEVIAYNLELPYDLFIYNVIFKNHVNLGSSHFQRLRIRDAVFERFVYFDQAVFEKNLELRRDVFAQGVYFKGAQIGADLLMDNCKILGKQRVPQATYGTLPSEFWQINVGRSAVFDGTYFEGETSFARSNFSSASFVKTRFDGKVAFSRMTTGSDTSFAGAVFAGETLFDRTSFGDTSFKGAQFLGQASFDEMTIDGDLDMSENTFGFTEKPASLRRLNISKSFLFESILAPGGLDLRESSFNDLYLSAASAAPIPTIDLAQTTITRQLVMQSLQVDSFSANGLDNAGTLTIQNVGIHQTLDLRNARLNLLVIKDLAWPNNPLAFNLRGMTYTDIDIGDQGLNDRTWRGLVMLIDQSAYSPQAYQTLADFLANKGHPDWAQEVNLAMKRRERDDALQPFSAAWLWSWFLDIFAGYGYRPALAFVWSALVVAIGAWVYRREENMIPINQEAVKLRYNPILYSFALFLPYIDLGIAGKWEPNPDLPGASLYKHIHQILGWVLMPIALLAFGGVLG